MQQAHAEFLKKMTQERAKDSLEKVEAESRARAEVEVQRRAKQMKNQEEFLKMKRKIQDQAKAASEHANVHAQARRHAEAQERANASREQMTRLKHKQEHVQQHCSLRSEQSNTRTAPAANTNEEQQYVNEDVAETLTANTAVRGLRFYNMDIASTIKTGTELYLERDPDNQYDCNAIRVRLHIGPLSTRLHGPHTRIYFYSFQPYMIVCVRERTLSRTLEKTNCGCVCFFCRYGCGKVRKFSGTLLKVLLQKWLRWD